MNNELACLTFSILSTACVSSSGGSTVAFVPVLDSVDDIRYVRGTCRDGR